MCFTDAFYIAAACDPGQSVKVASDVRGEMENKLKRQHCGQHIEFPISGIGLLVACPHCYAASHSAIRRAMKSRSTGSRASFAA